MRRSSKGAVKAIAWGCLPGGLGHLSLLVSYIQDPGLNMTRNSFRKHFRRAHHPHRCRDPACRPPTSWSQPLGLKETSRLGVFYSKSKGVLMYSRANWFCLCNNSSPEVVGVGVMDGSALLWLPAMMHNPSFRAVNAFILIPILKICLQVTLTWNYLYFVALLIPINSNLHLRFCFKLMPINIKYCSRTPYSLPISCHGHKHT